jgi:hypothetical protein
MRCRRSNCRSVNPTHARFCRQCGMALSAAMVDPRVAGEQARRAIGGGVRNPAASRLAG